MTLDEALKIVEERYALRETYVSAETGKMIYVLSAECELREIPAVKLPGSGIGLFAPEVIDLAEGKTTIEVLFKKKELGKLVEGWELQGSAGNRIVDALYAEAEQEVLEGIASQQIGRQERESILERTKAMSEADLRKHLTDVKSNLGRLFRVAVTERFKGKIVEALLEGRIPDSE